MSSGTDDGWGDDWLTESTFDLQTAIASINDHDYLVPQSTLPQKDPNNQMLYPAQGPENSSNSSTNIPTPMPTITMGSKPDQEVLATLTTTDLNILDQTVGFSLPSPLQAYGNPPTPSAYSGRDTMSPTSTITNNTGLDANLEDFIEMDDFELAQATLESIATGKSTPLIKEELRYRIQNKRRQSGLQELRPEYKEPQPEVVSKSIHNFMEKHLNM